MPITQTKEFKMKQKYFKNNLLLLSLLSTPLLYLISRPSIVFAQNWCVGDTCASTVTCPGFFGFFKELSQCGHCITLEHLRCFTIAFAQFLLLVAMVYAVIRIILAGIEYSTAVGNPDKQTAAKKALIWSVIGLIVAFAAYAILILIASLVDVDPT